MDARDYLTRIGADHFAPTPTTDHDALRRLHELHLLAVPFENLDIHLGVPIELELDAILDKIVRRRRGGFCYELNAAFAWLLTELGFRVELLSARVARADGSYGIEHDHMTLRVETDRGDVLADVGFGDCFLHPVKLDTEHVSPDGYRLEQDGEFWILRHEQTRKYRFTLTPHVLEDFRPGCEHHQSSPESTFTRGVVTSIARPNGRTTLTGERLIELRDGERRELPIEGDVGWRRALEDHFGIALENS